MPLAVAFAVYQRRKADRGGALGHGYGLAFERSVLQMGALLLVVAALTRLMPGRRATA